MITEILGDIFKVVRGCPYLLSCRSLNVQITLLTFIKCELYGPRGGPNRPFYNTTYYNWNPHPLMKMVCSHPYSAET